MIELPPALILLGVFLFGLILGLFFAAWRAHRATRELLAENAQLKAWRDHQQILEETREADRRQLQDSFSALSAQALRQNNEQFLHLARQKLEQYQTEAKAGLAEKEKAVESLVKPIQEALAKTEKQIHNIEKERVEAYGNISRYLQSMAETQSQLQSETRSLVTALRRPEVRGQWGELTLRRLAELAGMVDQCDFFEQAATETEDGRRRPDMVVRMPNDCRIVVDAKTPLDAYLSALEADSDDGRKQFMAAHARNIQKRVTELSSKQYWAQFDNTPEFVVLFIPGEQFLNCALDIDRNLQDNALRAKIILATPNNFIGLLKTVAFGWRQQSLAENAQQIRRLGQELHDRMASFTSHLAGLGRSLDKSVSQYNQAVGSLERMVLPSTRKFTELGIHAKKELEELESIEKAPRMPAGAEESPEETIKRLSGGD